MQNSHDDTAANKSLLSPSKEKYKPDSITGPEREFIETFEKNEPEYARILRDTPEKMIMFHQDAYAAGYDFSEFVLLGMTIKYAGLTGKDVLIHGKNGETFRKKDDPNGAM